MWLPGPACLHRMGCFMLSGSHAGVSSPQRQIVLCPSASALLGWRGMLVGGRGTCGSPNLPLQSLGISMLLFWGSISGALRQFSTAGRAILSLEFGLNYFSKGAGA